MDLNRRQEKRILVFLTLLSIIFCHGMLLFSVVEADASENCSVIVHKRISDNGQTITNTGEHKTEAELLGTKPQNGARINVFDISDYFQQVRAQNKSLSLEETQQKIASEVFEDMKSKKLLTSYGTLLSDCPKVTGESEFGSGTAHIKLEKKGQYGKHQAYLITDEEVEGAKTSQPIVLLPFAKEYAAGTIHLYTKNVQEEDLVTRQPYFYKHAKDQAGADQGPLPGAKFYLYRYVNNEKYYLHQQQLNGENVWQKAESGEVASFYSEAGGKVTIGKYRLPPGSYGFEEVAAPKGYELSSASKQIDVMIPAAGDQEIQITVDGKTTAPEAAIVYNQKSPDLPKQPDENNPPGKNLEKKYPPTGEKRSNGLIILGFGLIAMVTLGRSYLSRHEKNN